MNKTLIALAGAAGLATGGASLGLSDTEERTAISAPGGATISSIAGDAGWGAVAGTGYRYDKTQKPRD